MTDTCPHCNANLKDEAIPEHERWRYPQNVTHYPRKIPVVWFANIVGWLCPDCKRRID